SSISRVRVSLNASGCARQRAPYGFAVFHARSARKATSAGEIGLHLIDDASQRLKRLAMRIHHRPYTWVEGHAAQVLEPGDTHTLKTASQRSGEMFSGLGDGVGRAGIRSSDDAQREGNGCHGTRPTITLAQ